MKSCRRVWALLALAIVAPTFGWAQEGLSPLDNLGPHIEQISGFGERADWSHDGKRILFLEKTFGDVYELELSTKALRPMTHHYPHEGYTRALYLSNGDILLSGAREFDAKEPWLSRRWQNAELWVLKRDLSGPPIALGVHCFEGPAVSRSQLRIAWTLDVFHKESLKGPGNPDGDVGGTFHVGDIVYENGIPKLANKRDIERRESFLCEAETQNFRPPEDKELIYSTYHYGRCEVFGVDIETGAVVNYSLAPTIRDEAEGIFPDGRHTTVECNKHDTSKGVDIYKLALDGSGDTERLTFFAEHAGYKATNPVVSDDGRYMAFQLGKVDDPAGVGRGLFIFDLVKYEATVHGAIPENTLGNVKKAE